MEDVLKQVKSKVTNAIEIYENAQKSKLDQWLIVNDLLAALYLVDDLVFALEKMNEKHQS